MVYKILADIVVIIHLLWIIFLILGSLWGRQRRWVKIFHLFGLSFALLLQTFGWYCPLTYLEAWLRTKHHPELAYTGSFIIYYVEHIIYIEISPLLITSITLMIFTLNLWNYLRR